MACFQRSQQVPVMSSLALLGCHGQGCRCPVMGGWDSHLALWEWVLALHGCLLTAQAGRQFFFTPVTGDEEGGGVIRWDLLRLSI